jgi:hypothetical protein
MTPPRFSISILATILSAAALALPAAAQTLLSVQARWEAPSTLTPSQAASVLAAEARGEGVGPTDAFEARKYLRTDRSASLVGPVATELARRLFGQNVGPEVRPRDLPPVLAWLDPDSIRDSSGQEVVRLTGEIVVLRVLNADPNLATTGLVHLTFHEDWKFCGGTLCSIRLPDPVRTAVGYELSVPLDSTAPGEAQSSSLLLEGGYRGTVHYQVYPALDVSRYLGTACDPLPSQTSWTTEPATIRFSHLAERTEAGRMNQIFCGFFATSGESRSRVVYTAGGAVAGPPPGGAASAVVNNPLDFALFQ